VPYCRPITRKPWRYADYVPQENHVTGAGAGCGAGGSARSMKNFHYGAGLGYFLLRAQDKGFQVLQGWPAGFWPASEFTTSRIDRPRPTAVGDREDGARCRLAVRSASRRRQCRFDAPSRPMSCARRPYHWSYKLGLLRQLAG